MLNSLIGIVASSGGAAAAAPAYESIASATGTGSVSVTFSSIPSTYTALQIRAIVRDTATATGTDYLHVRFNGDTGANYARHNINGTGAAVSASGSASASFIRINGTVLTGSLSGLGVGAFLIDIHDYASTTRNKTLRSFSGASLNDTVGENISLTSGLWINTNAVTSITITSGYTGFSTDSQFALYGIKGA
jgi:hypothetical protein